MSDDPKDYDVPDPYAVKLDEAQEILSEIQSILWYDDAGRLAVDKEWTSDTLEKIANAVKALGPKPRKMVPLRWIKYTVSLLLPEDSEAVPPKRLAEYLLLGEMHGENGIHDASFAISAQLNHSRVVTEDEARTLLAQLGYAKDHFEKE